jgi:hypothetical protein
MDRSRSHLQNPAMAIRIVARLRANDRHRDLRKKGFDWANSV